MDEGDVDGSVLVLLIYLYTFDLVSPNLGWKNSCWALYGSIDLRTRKVGRRHVGVMVADDLLVDLVSYRYLGRACFVHLLEGN